MSKQTKYVMLVQYDIYKIEDFTCKKCSWHGRGSELVKAEMSETHLIFDLECPVCFSLVAFWQAPLKEDENEGKTIC